MAESNSSSRIFLLSSLALGVLAMVAAFVFLQNTAGKETGPVAEVLVAKHDLRENAIIDPEKDLQKLPVPASMSELVGRALEPALMTAYKGQRVNRNMQAGQIVLKSDLGAGGVLDLRPGMMAMSLPIKSANALGGLLVPGQYVRLLVTRPAPMMRATSGPSDMEALPGTKFEADFVGPPFKVLAINDRLSRSRAQLTAADAYQSAGESMSNSTITLEVTEADAKLIEQETGAGKFPISLTLCASPAEK